MRHDREAVLITGEFGSGKTSVAVEMADMLEKRHVPFAVLDLDWLTWCATGSDDDGAEHRMMLSNLVPVVANYLAAGIRFFVLARAVRTRPELDSLRASLPMPLKVVRLTVPWPEIERRLRSDITAGRQDDLHEAATWVGSEDASIEDATVSNDRPIREAAMEVLDWLGWL